MSTKPNISGRKADHIDLCTNADVGFRAKTNLFDAVDFIHNALPDLAVSDIDTTAMFAGKHLKAPLIIAAMTGGVDRAAAINRDLATVAEDLGFGFAFGSQRPMLSAKSTAGYQVRDVAPTTLILGNIGVVQAKQASTTALAEMVKISGADALCVHLNPAMEVVQPEGDDDFRGGLDTISRLVDTLGVPVIVKETGCGISRAVGERLKAIGVEYIDTSGAGGTSWVAVETQRAQGERAGVGDTFWDWGIPTAASVAQLSGLNFKICATGGMQDGLMIAKAVALGAAVGGIARPFLQAHAASGIDGVYALAERVIAEVKVAALLTGSKNMAALGQAPLIVDTRLSRWLPKASPLAARLEQ
jgi:isopentenyl-diphosphate delta-isomerase